MHPREVRARCRVLSLPLWIFRDRGWFKVADQTINSAERLLAGVFVLRQILAPQIAIINGIDKVIEYFTDRAFRDADELGKFLVPKSGEAFGNVSRS